MSVALFPGDPLYEMQDGKDGYCSQQEFDLLRSEVYEHEVVHRKREIDLRKQMKLHEVYETFVYAPARGMSKPKILVAINVPAKEYAVTTLSNDIAVDTPGFTTTLTCQPRGLP